MESYKGNNFIPVAIEYYTCWLISKNKDRITTVEFLYINIFCIFDPLAEILTDRGTHFKNEMIKEFCNLVNVNHRFSNPYYPQTTSM